MYKDVGGLHAPWNQRLSLCWFTQAALQRMLRSGGPGWGSWGPSAREPHAPSCKGRWTSAPQPPGGPDRSCNQLRKAWHNFNNTSAHSTEEVYKELVVQLWGCSSRCHAKLAIKIQLSVRKYMRFAWSGDTRLFHSGDGEEAWDRSVEEPRFIPP